MSDGGDKPDDAQKTEDPTPKKLEEARKKGNIPLSREVNNWIMLLAGTLIISLYFPYMFAQFSAIFRFYIEKAHTVPGTPGGLYFLLGNAAKETLSILALPMIFFVFAAFIGPFAQVGPLFSTKTITPELSKISIMKGFGRLFSLRSIMEFVKGLAKIILVAVVGFIILQPFYGGVEHIIDLSAMQILIEMKDMAVRMMTGILVVLLVIALMDLVYQRNQYMKQMRMTKQEVKDEYKQTEGDPMIKGKLRQLRAEKARQRMMQAVPQADVVITNPTHYSIALKYDTDTMDAPVCIAKGVDEVALRIREVAKEHNIILYENVPLARALYDTVEIDEMIPPEHFKAVAEVISYVFRMKGKLKKK